MVKYLCELSQVLYATTEDIFRSLSVYFRCEKKTEQQHYSDVICILEYTERKVCRTGETTDSVLQIFSTRYKF